MDGNKRITRIFGNGGSEMKKHQDKRDILKGFYDYLKSNDIKIIRQTNSKSYVNNKPHNGENETTLVNFHYEMKHISDKDIDREISMYIFDNFEL